MRILINDINTLKDIASNGLFEQFPKGTFYISKVLAEKIDVVDFILFGSLNVTEIPCEEILSDSIARYFEDYGSGLMAFDFINIELCHLYDLTLAGCCNSVEKICTNESVGYLSIRDLMKGVETSEMLIRNVKPETVINKKIRSLKRS